MSQLGVDQQSVHFETECYSSKLSHQTVCRVEASFGSKCHEVGSWVNGSSRHRRDNMYILYLYVMSVKPLCYSFRRIPQERSVSVFLSYVFSITVYSPSSRSTCNSIFNLHFLNSVVLPLYLCQCSPAVPLSSLTLCFFSRAPRSA